MSNNLEFWSSTGSPSADDGESLTYRLEGPACRVSYVTVALYKATYQMGHPIYPPSEVSFEMGATPHTLQPCSPRYNFQVPACAHCIL